MTKKGQVTCSGSQSSIVIGQDQVFGSFSFCSVLGHAGCYNKSTIGWGLRQQTFISHGSGRWDIQANSVCGEGSLPGS